MPPLITGRRGDEANSASNGFLGMARNSPEEFYERSNN